MDNKKYLSLEGLRVYDGLIKQELENHTHSYNDLTDRTHWVEEEYETIIPVTTDTIDIETSDGFIFDIDDEYLVIVDGVEYVCQPYINMAGEVSLGDSRLNYDGNDMSNPIDVPFCAESYLGSVGLDDSVEVGLVYVAYSDSETHTIEIKKPTGNVSYHTLDEQFIPDTIARKSDLSSITVEEATHATSADTATTAETAVKATQDGNGAVITDTYETKEDAQAKYDELNGAKANAGHTHSYNDLTDRTHWVEQATDVLLEEQSVTGEEQEWSDGYYYYIEGLDTVAYCGEQYIITVDGVSYNCESYVSMYGENAIGDSRLSNYIDEEGTLNTEHPEDVPFHIQTYYYSEESWELINDWCEWEIRFATAGTHTVKIERINPNETTYNTLDENFIPDTIARKSYVDSLHIKYDKLESTEWSSAHRVSKYRASIPSVTSLTTGTLITVLVYEACASNATLNVNGLGEKPIYYRAEPIKELAFPTNTMVALVYSTDYPVTTGAWHCIYTPGGSSSNVDLSTYETKEDAQTKYNTITEAKADWNQNDENAIDYVKNRTHWVENGGVVILPECQPPYDENEGAFVIPGSVPLESGKTVTLTVNWNGTDYECKTYWMSMDAENDTVICGNSAVMLEMWGITAEENECPFIIGAMPGMGMCMFLPLDGSTELTVSIYQGGGEVIHHLDPKYIKDMYHVEQAPVTGLAETTYENVSSPIQMQTVLPITVGATYTVMWNGTLYECTASSGVNGIKYLGNGAIYGVSENTGEPFFIITSDSDNVSIIIFNDGSTTVTLSYEGVVNKIHTIDPKYIPENILPHNTNLVNGSAKGSLRTVYSAEEDDNYVMGDYAFAEGYDTKAYNRYSHAEGKGTTASADSAHAEGETTTASGICSHAEGCSSKALASYSHAEGYNTKASVSCAHAEGCSTTASGLYSHSEGYNTIASGDSAHAEGQYVEAKGKYSHAEGYWTKARSAYQHVQGKYNVVDESGRYAHIVGNGEHVYYDNGTQADVLSNAHTLDWEGNAWYAGTIKVGGTSYDDASEVALKSDFDSLELISLDDIDAICGVTTS